MIFMNKKKKSLSTDFLFPRQGNETNVTSTFTFALHNSGGYPFLLLGPKTAAEFSSLYDFIESLWWEKKVCFRRHLSREAKVSECLMSLSKEFLIFGPWKNIYRMYDKQLITIRGRQNPYYQILEFWRSFTHFSMVFCMVWLIACLFAWLLD